MPECSQAAKSVFFTYAVSLLVIGPALPCYAHALNDRRLLSSDKRTTLLCPLNPFTRIAEAHYLQRLFESDAQTAFRLIFSTYVELGKERMKLSLIRHQRFFVSNGEE